MMTRIYRPGELAGSKKKALAALSLAMAMTATSMLTLAATAKPAQAAFPGKNGKIAFQSNRDGNDEIYVMNQDGANPTNLTQNPKSDRDPAWSPDGKKIAFTSFRDGSAQIFVMNANGSNPVNISNDTAAFEDLPSWSPDGKRSSSSASGPVIAGAVLSARST